MRRLIAALSGLILLPACAQIPVDRASLSEADVYPRLEQFGSDAAFTDWFGEYEKRYFAEFRWSPRLLPFDPPLTKQNNSLPPLCNPEFFDCREEIIVTGSRIAGSPASITNNQHAGVDEGDVVKRIGDHLIILQDGRLFAATIQVNGAAALAFTGRIDLYDDPEIHVWYDEMLVHDRRILVTGYSYDLDAAVYVIARIDESGFLSREATYLVDGNDYYSGENYASRIVGDHFITYMRIDLEWFVDEALPVLPVVRRAESGTPESVGPPFSNIYMPLQHLESPVLYLINVCDSRALPDDLGCETTGFIAGEHAEFYVTETNAYLWTQRDSFEWSQEHEIPALLNDDDRSLEELDPAALSLANLNPVFRLELGTGDLTVAAISGFPPSQLAIESRDQQFQALVVRDQPRIDAEADDLDWEYDLQYVSIPETEFNDLFRPASPDAYTPVPFSGDFLWDIETRFVGDWLVYGHVEGWHPPEDDELLSGDLVFVPVDRPEQHISQALGFAPLRIDQVGGHPVVTGYRGPEGLHVSWFDLDTGPTPAGSVLLADRFESEGRSHAFNGIMTGSDAIFGVPTVRRPEDAGRWWWESDASDLSFLTYDISTGLVDAGEIAGSENNVAPGYTCEVSCIDWYGNSRPIFTDGRIFALSGAEIAEAELVDGRVAEIRRINLTASPAD